MQSSDLYTGNLGAYAILCTTQVISAVFYTNGHPLV